MTNLVLTRKAGQSVRLLIGDKTEYLSIKEVTGGFCVMYLNAAERGARVRFRDSMRTSVTWRPR